MESKYESLIEKAAACKLGPEATPLERAKAIWALYVFLNEVDPLELFISVGHALEELEPELRDADRDEMRKLGCEFPEDWDTPTAWFTGENKPEDDEPEQKYDYE